MRMADKLQGKVTKDVVQPNDAVALQHWRKRFVFLIQQ
jgi:hypothetical protein